MYDENGGVFSHLLTKTHAKEIRALLLNTNYLCTCFVLYGILGGYGIRLLEEEVIR
jgi:hypothetical protein